MKKTFVCGIMFLCSIFMVGCGCSRDASDSLKKINEDDLSGKFFENQIVDMMEIQNFNIVVEDGTSFISFDVSNTATTPVSVEYIKIFLYDSEENLILESYGYVGGTLEASEIKHIGIDVDIDLSEVKRVAYEKM